MIHVGTRRVTTFAEALAVAGFGVLLAVGSLHLLNGLARLSAWHTKVMLGGSAEG